MYYSFNKLLLVKIKVDLWGEFFLEKYKKNFQVGFLFCFWACGWKLTHVDIYYSLQQNLFLIKHLYLPYLKTFAISFLKVDFRCVKISLIKFLERCLEIYQLTFH